MSADGEQKKKTSHVVPWTVGAVVAAVALALYFYPAREAGVTQPVFGFAHPTPDSTLVATLSTNAIQSRTEEVELRLEASRDPTAQLGNITVCIEAPGFRVDGGDSCVAVTAADRSVSGTSQRPVSIKLIPTSSSGKYRLLLNASWARYVPRQAKETKKSTKTQASTEDCLAQGSNCLALLERMLIPVGPVSVEIDRWGRFASRVTIFVKDMALPIILLVLGVQLNNLTAKRDRRRAAIEAAHDRARKEQEREQDEDRQIVRILLPKVMDLASKYYLPMTWNAERFVMASAKGTESAQELVFHLLNFFVVARGLKEHAGGIFLKDLDGEKIFVAGNRILRVLSVEAAGGEAEFTYALDKLAATAPKGKWPRLADVQSPKTEAWTKLEVWVKSLDATNLRGVRYFFNALRGVLRYESNSPYFNWYHGTGAPIIFTLIEEIAEPEDRIFGDDLQSVVKEFKETLEGYRKRKKLEEEKQAEKDRREAEAQEIVAFAGDE
jgi:hypothetical protein